MTLEGALLPPDDPRAPKYWMWETTGKLKPAVRAYLAGQRLDPFQIAIMRRYLAQWLASPVWRPGKPDAQGVTPLARLRERADFISTNDDVREVIEAAVDLGADPL